MNTYAKLRLENHQLREIRNELLEVCVKAEQFLANDPNRGHDGWLSDTLRQLRTAIAKAETITQPRKEQAV